MHILLVVKITTFLSNTVSIFMLYSKISGMQNLELLKRLPEVKIAFKIFVKVLHSIKDAFYG